MSILSKTVFCFSLLYVHVHYTTIKANVLINGENEKFSNGFCLKVELYEF